MILTRGGSTSGIEIRPDGSTARQCVGIISTGVAPDHVADLRVEVSADVDALIGDGWSVIADDRLPPQLADRTDSAVA